MKNNVKLKLKNKVKLNLNDFDLMKQELKTVYILPILLFKNSNLVKIYNYQHKKNPYKM